MCGIVAYFSRTKPVSLQALKQAANTLSHRGPDDGGQWIGSDGLVGLAHARLSIIDQQSGHQPLSNESRQIHAVVNGEFYDFERIRVDLESRGHRFRSKSDSEILLHLYEEFGTHCIQHLRGEFAFVLWDQRRSILLVARDRFGIKPLFFSQCGDTLTFASEAKALFSLGHHAKWDDEYVQQRLLTGMYSSDRTLFKGVQQVPPGHYLQVTANGQQLVKYWDIDFPPAATVSSDDSVSEGKYIEEFRSVLTESVRLRLRADVPVGFYLSGGLDSCALLGLASSQMSSPMTAFTISFEDPAYDEESVAREMADTCNANFIRVPLTDSDLADNFGTAIYHAEQPFSNAHGIAKYCLSKRVNESGYRVVLTGEGADEILAGYAHFRRDLLLKKRNSRSEDDEANRLISELSRKNAISAGLILPVGESLPLDAVRRIIGVVPTWIEAMASSVFPALQLLNEEMFLPSTKEDAFIPWLNGIDVRGQLEGRCQVSQAQYLWTKTMLPNYNLSVLGDRMEMANSVEGRVPYLDHHVAEFARTLPISLKIKDGVEKFVLREAAKPFLTARVYQKQKQPFFAPPTASTPGSVLCDLVQDVLRSSMLERVPFYDKKKVSRVLDSLSKCNVQQRSQLDPVLMNAAGLCLLAQRFGIQ